MLSTKNLRMRAEDLGSAVKLMPKYVGPFKVTDRIGTQAYRLDLPDTYTVHNVFHTSLLRPYTSVPTHRPCQLIGGRGNLYGRLRRFWITKW
jgi:hypothetical protein